MVYEPEIGDVDEGIVLLAQLVVASNQSVVEMRLTKLAKMRATVKQTLLADCDDRKYGGATHRQRRARLPGPGGPEKCSLARDARFS